MTELLVAATLLVSGIAVIAPVAVRTSQLWKDSRHYTIAVAELQNQMERLTSLDRAELETALAELGVSLAVRESLVNSRIDCEQLSDGGGDRLVLSLSWDRPGTQKPVTLVGWLPESDDLREPTASPEVEP